MSGEKYPAPKTSAPDGIPPAEAPGREQTAVQNMLEGFRDHCKRSALDIATKNPADGSRLAEELHNYLRMIIDRWNERQAKAGTGRRTPSISDRQVMTYLDHFYKEHDDTLPTDGFRGPLRDQYLQAGRKAALERQKRYTEIAAIVGLADALHDAGHDVAGDNANVLLAAIGMSFVSLGVN